MADIQEIDGLASQEEYARQLQAEQFKYRQRQEIEKVVEEGKSYRSPSRVKYGILFGLAIVVDVVDLSEFTGIGYFFAKALSIICTVVIIAILFLTGGNQKKARGYRKRLEDVIEDAGRNVAYGARMILRVGKIAKYAPWLGGMVKFILAAAANLLPVLGLFPWMTIGIWLSYMDEKKTLRDAYDAAHAVEEVGLEQS